MFFANGQNYNVILSINEEDRVIHELMHEPMPVIPRREEWFFYKGQWYYVMDVAYYYPTGVKKSKMSVYLNCIPGRDDTDDQAES